MHKVGVGFRKSFVLKHASNDGRKPHLLRQQRHPARPLVQSFVR